MNYTMGFYDSNEWKNATDPSPPPLALMSRTTAGNFGPIYKLSSNSSATPIEQYFKSVSFSEPTSIALTTLYRKDILWLVSGTSGDVG